MFRGHPNRIPMRIAVTLCLASLALPAAAQVAPADSAVTRAAEAFTDAIVRHDSLAAASLLAPDARILEGGAVETREEYLAHHFHADAAFLAAMERTPIAGEIRVEGDVAWMTSATRLVGTWRDREVDATSVETLVLLRGAEGWRIASVHWSSGSTAR
jgi:ketosteroid isomerase-like protein